MPKELKITADDIRLAGKFCQALDECFLQYGYDCIFKMPTGDVPCLNCPIAKFKLELSVVNAQSFLDAIKRILVQYTIIGQKREEALHHLFIGLGAIYSANQRKIPPISQELINELGVKGQADPIRFIREITDELKGLGSEWYGIFWETWQKLELSEEIWLGNIFLLKIFLEAARADPAKTITNHQESSPQRPIESLGSEEKREEFFSKISEFLKKEREKKGGGDGGDR